MKKGKICELFAKTKLKKYVYSTFNCKERDKMIQKENLPTSPFGNYSTT